MHITWIHKFRKYTRTTTHGPSLIVLSNKFICHAANPNTRRSCVHRTFAPLENKNGGNHTLHADDSASQSGWQHATSARIETNTTCPTEHIHIMAHEHYRHNNPSHVRGRSVCTTSPHTAHMCMRFRVPGWWGGGEVVYGWIDNRDAVRDCSHTCSYTQNTFKIMCH